MHERFRLSKVLFILSTFSTQKTIKNIIFSAHQKCRYEDEHTALKQPYW